MHWLQSIAARADIPGIDDLALPSNVAPSVGWESVTRAAGLPQRELVQRIARAMRLVPADLEAVEPPAHPIIPEKLARKYHVFPLRGDSRTVTVATSDPTDIEAEQGLAFATGRRVGVELASPADISEALSATFSVERAVEVLLGKVGAEQMADDVS